MANDAEILDRIRAEIASCDVVLFMQGTPVFPMCSPSAQIVQLLGLAGIENYKSIDVLADPGLAHGLHLYSAWPTVPQLYVHGQFIGGCDIVRELCMSGRLAELAASAPAVERVMGIEPT